MDRIEARLDALEGKVRRYRNVAVVLALMLAGVVLVGATTDGIQDVVKTKHLLVFNEAGGIVLQAGASDDGNGLLKIRSKAGKNLNVTVRTKDGWPATIHWRKLDYPVTKVLA